MAKLASARSRNLALALGLAGYACHGLAAAPGERDRAPDVQASAAGVTLFGTKRVRIGRTAFDRQWHRVRSEPLLGPSGPVLRASSPADERGLLALVNAYANRRIRYRSDQALHGQADYWASAGETLARGAGDCEDIAILKMRLLEAAGIASSAIELTIVRDPVRRTDHAVLVVRSSGRDWLLDVGRDQPLAAAEARAYIPVLSFGADGTWVHGYRNDSLAIARLESRQGSLRR